MICSQCNSERVTKTNRLPRGWKRQDKRPICGDCWRARYLLRAITFPIVGPVDRDWPDLRQTLGNAWSQSTALSNWLLTEMYARDVRREPGMKKLPPMPDIYLYPEARQRFPDLPTATVTSIMHCVRGRYRAARLKLLWTSQTSLSNYRYPTPFPVAPAAWKPLLGMNNVPLVNVRLDCDRWTLRLRGGPHFRRQLRAFRQLVDGHAIKSELALYRQRANRGDHRTGVDEREPGGADRLSYRTMCKLVAWLPRQQLRDECQGVLHLSTGRDCFWTALISGRDQNWAVYADHVVRWQQAHRRRTERLTADMVSTGNRRVIGAHRLKSAEKFHRRIQSFCHEVTAQLAKYAERQRVARVCYDDSERNYLSEFPWHQIRTLLKDKLDERGIEFEHGTFVFDAKSLKAA